MRLDGPSGWKTLACAWDELAPDGSRFDPFEGRRLRLHFDSRPASRSGPSGRSSSQEIGFLHIPCTRPSGDLSKAWLSDGRGWVRTSDLPRVKDAPGFRLVAPSCGFGC